MCGIVAVLRRDSTRALPDLDALVAEVEKASGSLSGAPSASELPALRDTLDAVAARLAHVDRDLHGVPGARALIAGGSRTVTLRQRLGTLPDGVAAVDRELDSFAGPVAGFELEAVNAAMVRVKDAVWALRRDRLPTADAVADLVGADATPRAIEGFLSIQVALSALDRLEVRGRDSAGLHLLVRDHGLDLSDPAVTALLATRTDDPLLGSGSVRTPDGMLAFVYKAAAEIGELGDNTAHLRRAMRADELLHLALASGRAVVLGHTRWASVGIISEANAHPLNQEEPGRGGTPYVTAALNGDVDNFADLKAENDLRFPPEITTDAKVIPALVSHGLAAGAGVTEAFRETVAGFEGSVAIGALVAGEPDRVYLALRGSGQSLNVGLAEDAFVVSSEPYGLVEETDRYVRMDGETPADPDRPDASRGQVVVLSAAGAGDGAGIERLAYDGTPLPINAEDVRQAEITTRDIDRGDFPHFLLKELAEAPASFRKTLRGKVLERDARLAVELGPETLPEAVRAALRDRTLRRVIVIGQGTAAVAGESLAVILDRLAGDRLTVSAIPATELSGFALEDDMHDALVVAISQSGTTTDTNRTVDVVRDRGARILAIVNRRNSDLVARADGVLYTSDGRDVEMSVASTKAFYSQIAAGALLALAIAGEAQPEDEHDQQAVDKLLRGLVELPDAMRAVLDRRATIAVAAARYGPVRRHWAVVGNGPNQIAAREARIKLSELCYKSIACDVTEDKKHIDLSSEPLVLVCAAGIDGSNADDTAKEVAIYGAHRAAPIVIATDGEGRFSAAVETLYVPPAHSALAFVLSAMAGHLFGYEAALAIDASARPLREARAAIESTVSELGAGNGGGDLLMTLARRLELPSRTFLDGLRANEYDGSLDASTAVRVGGLLRYATGVTSLDSYQVEYGKVGTPSVVVDDLTAALTRGIEELTRPVDAIKHQAKTVTVGISRADDSLMRVRLVQDVLAAGCPRDGLSYRALRTLAALDPAVEAVTGFTRYRIEGDPMSEGPTIHVVDRGGISVDIPSRTDTDARLRGTKHRVAVEREVTAARAAGDGRTLVLVPEVKGNQTTGLTLLHVRFAGFLPSDRARGVLQGYRGRNAALRDAVLETEPTFDESRLASISLVDLLTEPIVTLARQWRS
ncbi:MAG: SIS domain-containing protein [Acidimicrobiia bacterium]